MIMSAPLERWAKQAVLLEERGDFMPVADSRVMEDVMLLARLHKMTWERRERKIRDSGEPFAMPEGTFAGLLAYPAAQTITTTSINGTANLWSNLVYTPIALNSIMAPQIYRMMLAAKITTSTSPGNIGLNPLINNAGTWTTGGTAVSGGSTLGATGNVALTASITNAFYYVIGDMTIRNAGTSSVIVAMFHYVSTQGTSGGLAGPAAVGTGHNLLFGGTSVTVDTQTTAQSLQFGAVHTVTTITHNIEQPHFMDWN
jgi:hypothetical protein